LEETGVRCELIDFADAIQYHHGDRPKVVAYYRMRILDAIAFEANEEVDQILWLAPVDAISKLSYETERGLVQTVTDA
jgi:8-oxo-dGTP diphosphatase